VRAIALEPGYDDRRVLGDDFDGSDDAHSDAWCDKIGRVPVGANLNLDQRDRRAMQLLLQLVSFDDWFLWYVFASRDFQEARLVVVRG
jgi:hypothetical protein